MSSYAPVGILGLGAFLPEKPRTNDWWPRAVVDEWTRKLATSFMRWEQAAGDNPTPGMVRVLKALAELKDDPFQGSVHRHAMPPDMFTWDMDTHAAREAVQRSGVDPKSIDLILSYTLCPEYLNVPNACVVHERLGLRPDCFSLNGDAVCNSFLSQLTVAQQLIQAGRAHYALLIQSSGVSRIAEVEDPSSAWWADAATAVVVGPVKTGRGLLGSAFETDGALYNALVIGTKNGRWYQEGHGRAYPLDMESARNMILGTPDCGSKVIPKALADANLTADDVTFYASHQATKWFRRVSQEHVGLTRARSVDTFTMAGTVSAANIPLVLATAEREGALRDDDVIAMYAGGTGMTYGSVVLRWGN